MKEPSRPPFELMPAYTLIVSGSTTSYGSGRRSAIGLARSAPQSLRATWKRGANPVEPTTPPARGKPAGSSELPFELLESKLLVPRRADSVPRTELVARMDGSIATPVVLVCAGPGWGKTTLLAQWAASAKRPFAWVEVDERDNDPVVLLTYVATALDRLSPIDPAVFDALSTPGISVEGTLVPRLGAALVNASDRFVLVL